MQLTSSLASKGWKSWYSLIIAVPLMLNIAFYSWKMESEREAAEVQQTSFGLITDCRDSGKSGYNCAYWFTAEGKNFGGYSSVANDVHFGQTVVVYYDSHNPTVSALEDLNEKSRKDRRLILILFALLAALGAFALYTKASGSDSYP